MSHRFHAHAAPSLSSLPHLPDIFFARSHSQGGWNTVFPCHRHRTELHPRRTTYLQPFPSSTRSTVSSASTCEARGRGGAGELVARVGRAGRAATAAQVELPVARGAGWGGGVQDEVGRRRRASGGGEVEFELCQNQHRGVELHPAPRTLLWIWYLLFQRRLAETITFQTTNVKQICFLNK